MKREKIEKLLQCETKLLKPYGAIFNESCIANLSKKMLVRTVHWAQKIHFKLDIDSDYINKNEIPQDILSLFSFEKIS